MKILKYDWKRVRKVYLVTIVILILFQFLRIYLYRNQPGTSSSEDISWISGTFFYLVFMYFSYQFYNAFFLEEGYIFHLFPVSRKALFYSKWGIWISWGIIYILLEIMGNLTIQGLDHGHWWTGTTLGILWVIFMSTNLCYTMIFNGLGNIRFKAVGIFFLMLFHFFVLRWLIPVVSLGLESFSSTFVTKIITPNPMNMYYFPHECSFAGIFMVILLLMIGIHVLLPKITIIS